MDPQIVAFAGVAAVLTITPGVDMALVTRAALEGGRAVALRTTLGIVGGLLIWAAASAVGIAALLGASATAFTVLKLVGAAYLVLLGLRTIGGTLGQGSRQRPSVVPGGESSRAGAAFRQGLLTNLLNPKIAVFYATLLPQFIERGDPVLLKSLLLAAIHATMSLAWLSGYAAVVTRAGATLRRPAVSRTLERVTGVVLVGLGVRLALQER